MLRAKTRKCLRIPTLRSCMFACTASTTCVNSLSALWLTVNSAGQDYTLAAYNDNGVQLRQLLVFDLVLCSPESDLRRSEEMCVELTVLAHGHTLFHASSRVQIWSGILAIRRRFWRTPSTRTSRFAACTMASSSLNLPISFVCCLVFQMRRLAS